MIRYLTNPTQDLLGKYPMAFRQRAHRKVMLSPKAFTLWNARFWEWIAEREVERLKQGNSASLQDGHGHETSD